MTRAIRILVVGPSEEACLRLRLLAGPDADVIASATGAAGLTTALADAHPEAAVVDARTPEAFAVLEELGRTRPGTPVVWVGESAPAGTRLTVSPERVSDDLPRAVERAVAGS